MELLSTQLQVKVNQIEFSLTQHTAMLDGTLDYMQKNQIECMSWSPLGVVFKENYPKIEAIKSVLTKLSEKYEAEIDTILLSWILKHPANISPVIGTTNKKRIKNANKALKIDLELEDWFILLEANNGHEVP